MATKRTEWMYSDISPETIGVLVRDTAAILGRPHPNEDRYIRAEWDRNTVRLIAHVEQSPPDALEPLTADAIAEQLDGMMRRELASDLPELEWGIEVEDYDRGDMLLWRIVLEVF